MRSSFHGKIEEIPGISVDNFENPVIVLARAYFLSHCHTDHTVGLYLPELLEVLEKTNANIYMSEPTAAVVRDECTDYRILEYIQILKLDSTTVTLPAVPEKDQEELCVTVTLIPAGHSFGSVMFLFETNTKTVLFTGDFRIQQKAIPEYAQFHNNGIPITIDAMYVDTTFLGSNYDHFPDRSTSVNKAIEEIGKWLRSDSNHHVALKTSAKYGYEFLFCEIYKQLEEKVYVNEDRWKFYSNITHIVKGVTNIPGKIHLCRNNTHIHCTPIHTPTNVYLSVRLSAMKWQNFIVDELSVNYTSPNNLDVCFATHCSNSELIYFINYFGAKKVVGFPNDYNMNKEVEKKVEASSLASSLASKPKKTRVDSKVSLDVMKSIFEP